MAERTEKWDVTGYGSYDNDPPGFDIANPNPRHTPATRQGTNPFWGVAYEGMGTFEYPAPFAADVRVIPAGTLIYVPHVQRYFEMVDWCQACRDATDQNTSRRLDLYVGGDLAPTAAKRNSVNNAANSITRLAEDGSGPVDVIFDPAPGKPVPNTNTISGISSGAPKNFGPARTGGTTPPPPTGETTITVAIDVYSQAENGGTDTASGNAAGGTGTFADPITAAGGPGGPPQGAIIYDDALDKYFIVEDTSTAPLVYWVGNANATQTANIRAAVRGTRQIIVNATSGKPVNNQSFIALYGGSVTPPPPTTEEVIMQLPKIFGWSGDPWVRNDSVVSFSEGDLRVNGTGWPAAQIVQPVTAGRQYRVATEFLDNPGWLKVTNPANDAELAGVYEVGGAQSLTFTPTANEVYIWAGLAGDGAVRVRNLTVTAL